MSAAEDAYARLMAAQHAESLLTVEQRRFAELERERERVRDAKTRLMKRKLPRVY